jgi:3-hydroxymyristoyl/3-hydroxydecanoyl-(acyl carrier protein) dehydratase
MNSSTRGPGTILQAFDFELSSGGEKFYEGWALFGYFTSASLTTSAGLDRGTSVEPWREQMPASLSSELIPVVDATGVRQLQALNDLMMVPGGGELSGDYLYGRVLISPDDWFFRAHFYQDPVMPGSLGVEAVLEAMRRYARRRYPSLRGAQEVAVTQQTVTWRYRGQVTPQDPEVVLEVHLHTPQTASGNVVFVGDASVWKSGTRIYEITGAAVGFRKT